MDIYKKHDSAFQGVSAYVIAQCSDYHGIDRLATIAFSRNSKSGNVRCFFHFIGYPMQLGQAGGGGYDKHSAAFLEAVEKHILHMQKNKEAHEKTSFDHDLTLSRLILEAAKDGNGASRFYDALRKVGFFVLQAI